MAARHGKRLRGAGNRITQCCAALRAAHALILRIRMRFHIAVVHILPDAGDQLAAGGKRSFTEKHKINKHIVFHQEIRNRIHGDTHRVLHGIAYTPAEISGKATDSQPYSFASIREDR